MPPNLPMRNPPSGRIGIAGAPGERRGDIMAHGDQPVGQLARLSRSTQNQYFHPVPRLASQLTTLHACRPSPQVPVANSASSNLVAAMIGKWFKQH